MLNINIIYTTSKYFTSQMYLIIYFQMPWYSHRYIIHCYVLIFTREGSCFVSMKLNYCCRLLRNIFSSCTQSLYSLIFILTLFIYCIAFNTLCCILNRCIRVEQIKHIVGQSRVYPRFSCTNVFDKLQVYSHSHVVYVSTYAFIKIQDCDIY